MLNNVNFNKRQGGIGRQPLTSDYISGMAFFNDAVSLTQSQTEIQVFNAQEAQDQGLSGAYLERVEEFFRVQPNGNLYIGAYGTTDDYDKVLDLQNFAEGDIRQVLVVDDSAAFSDTFVSELQAVADTLESNYRPTQFVLECDFSSYTASDIKGAGRKNVSVVLGKDITKSYNAACTLLGLISRSKVSDSIAWVAKNNIEEGTNFNNVEVQGTALSNLTDTQLADLVDKGFITLRRFTDFSGVYFTDSTTADLQTSDFLYIENNRVIDKALRNLRVVLLPDLNSPSYVNEDGTLSEGTIAYFREKCQTVLDSLENNLEISQGQVTINPAQNVIATGELVVQVDIIPVGVNRTITVNLGFTTSF